jgi:hypothetical protein
MAAQQEGHAGREGEGEQQRGVAGLAGVEDDDAGLLTIERGACRRHSVGRHTGREYRRSTDGMAVTGGGAGSIATAPGRFRP